MSDRDPHLTLLDFTGHVGDFLGHGWGPHNGQRAWDAEMERNIKTAVRTGQSNFYRCVSMNRQISGHSWSFLRPTTKLTLADGESELLLPSDCGQQIEGVAVCSASGGVVATLRQTVGSEVRRLNAEFADQTGMPLAFAIEPHNEPGSGRQRWKMVFHPEADRDVTIRLTYPVVPSLMTEAQPFHWGGALHSETVLAAVVAAAELFRDDVRPGQGPRWVYYETLLETSVNHDRRARPQVLGYNGDGSDARWRNGADWETWTRYGGSLVTVNGITPE